MWVLAEQFICLLGVSALLDLHSFLLPLLSRWHLALLAAQATSLLNEQTLDRLPWSAALYHKNTIII